MKNIVFGACGAMALAATIGLSAQTPGQAQATPAEQQQKRQAMPQDMQKSMTLTGCLKTWDATAANESTGAPGAKAAPGTRYVLTEVQAAKGMDAKGTEGKAAADMPGMADNAQYALKAGPSVDLKSHVNQKVQVTGTVAKMDDMDMMHKDAKMGAEPKTPTQTGSQTSARRTGMDAAHGASDMWHTLTVSSITKLTGSCGS